MKPLALILSLLGLVGCAAPIKVSGIAVKGPNKGEKLHGTFYWAGTISGKAEVLTPWGEVCRGRYQTAVRGAYKKNTQQVDINAGDQFGESDAVIMDSPGVGVGTATLIGDQGTGVDVTYSTNTEFPFQNHGQGKAVDTRGNVYRLVW
jgi:hypothetical protein